MKDAVVGTMDYLILRIYHSTSGLYLFFIFFFSRPVRKYQNKAGEHFNQQVNLI